ncbi:GNAT family N-acetyltransferase [Catelliglobosispora koreensis]|uniref:GNAT family N-acetyltransferase n=1 Tax=Catelliglobosispora koreensis TaxID=129052 RepID=UPI0004772DFB|nr:GNAT family N-acetyltransferase [Catelliglobosispora koreensis]
MKIRPPSLAELPVLMEIEREAGHCFSGIGMPEIAADDPLPVAVLDSYRLAGMAWVAAESSDSPVAYLIADLIDGNLHIEQVSVRPSHAGQRIGGSLLEHAAQHAVSQGLAALTLTTFADVPWNAPYYERCGFYVLDDDLLPPGLRVVRQREAEHGLDRWPRVCMRRDL